jgi:hypothetical protein
MGSSWTTSLVQKYFNKDETAHAGVLTTNIKADVPDWGEVWYKY